MPAWTFKARAASLGAGAFALVLASAAPRAAQAQTVCLNCSTVVQQLMEYAMQAESYRTQLQQYATQAQQYANMVQNTVALPQMVWGSLQSDVAQVQNLLRMGDHLALSSGFSVGQLGSYAGYVGSLTNVPDKYRRWSEQANSNIASVMRGLGTQQDRFAADQANLRWAQGAVASADGQLRAIQAHAAVSSAGVDEMQKLRQAILAQAQMTANIAQQDADRQALAAAQLTQFQELQPAAMAGGARY